MPSDGEHCQVCGVAYDDVYWLPDVWWAAITPKPGVVGAGLLCPPCALSRLTVPDPGRWVAREALRQVAWQSVRWGLHSHGWNPEQPTWAQEQVHVGCFPVYVIDGEGET